MARNTSRDFARELRRELTPAERILWPRLRDRRLKYKFRRQHPVGRYIADFCCVSAMLIVELDGPSHVETPVRDEVRDQFLCDRGFHVLRFWNDRVYEDLEMVLDTIFARCDERDPLASKCKV